VDLDLVRIECDVAADSPTQLIAVIYNALRRFEAEFRASCCKTLLKSCSSCSGNDVCPYWLVFAQQLSADPEIVRLHQKPSLPFSLYIDEKNCNKLSCTVGLVIFGSAVNFLELFKAALSGMVASAVNNILPTSEFMLNFYTLDYHGVRHEIKNATSLSENVIMLSGQYVLNNTVHSETARLSFASPLRLQCNGSIAHSFDIATFFRSQLRRCSSLFTYYGSGNPDLDYVALSLAAQNIAVLEDGIHYTQPHWSKRQNMAGLIGSAELAGLAEPMYALLLLGSYVNAGKGATFGLGFYHIEEL
jgi:hypothetical protein